MPLSNRSPELVGSSGPLVIGEGVYRNAILLALSMRTMPDAYAVSDPASARAGSSVT